MGVVRALWGHTVRAGWAAALCVALAIALPGRAAALGSCGQGGPLGTTMLVPFEGSLYYVTTPIGYDPAREWPLIVGLHGDEGDPAASVNQNWAAVPDGRFIFVAPKSPTANGSWYNPAEIAQTQAWFDSLLQSLMAQYNVDLDNVHAWGLSGGAEFLAYHGLGQLQNVLATIQFNMGGNYWGWFLGGSPTRQGTCKVPARFSTFDGLSDQCVGYVSGGPPPLPGAGSPTEGDFLCPTSKALYDTLTMLGHETEWTDWGAVPCLEPRGHCWNPVQNGAAARDWMLARTLCGFDRPDGCGEPHFADPLTDPPWLTGADPAPTSPPPDPTAPVGEPTPVTPSAEPTPVPAAPGPSPGIAGGAAPAPVPAPGSAPVGSSPAPTRDPGASAHSDAGGCATASTGARAAGAPMSWLLPMSVLWLWRRRRRG